MVEKTNRGLSERSSQTRSVEARPNLQRWRPPNMLEIPSTKGDLGFYFARQGLNGVPDDDNIADLLREGLRPATLEEIGPEFKHLAGSDGRIRQRGLILMCMPLDMWKERDNYYQTAMDNQARGADTLQGIRREVKDNSFQLKYEVRSPGGEEILDDSR